MVIDVEEYREFYKRAEYSVRFTDYYPGNQTEKSLEHYLAAKLLNLRAGEVDIDIASERSPAPDIYSALFAVESYRQDITYPPGLNGHVIGGPAEALPLPAGFADKVALHCSLEHFEGTGDIEFAKEARRVLRRSGRVCVVPLYVAEEFAVQTDPALGEDVEFDPGALVHLMPGWGNRHGRFYDPEQLTSRLRGLAPFTVYWVQNAAAVDPSCYLRFALVSGG